MAEIGHCSQTEYAQSTGSCNGNGAYRMNIPKDVGGKPHGWVIVCEPCENRFGNINLVRAGYVQRNNLSWKAPKREVVNAI